MLVNGTIFVMAQRALGIENDHIMCFQIASLRSIKVRQRESGVQLKE